MRHAYLIMAHHEPEILKLLLSRLDHSNNDFYVHLDRKSSIDPDDIASAVKQSKLVFIERKRISWGDYSQIDCEMRLLERAVQGEYDYYHLMTGVDLPLKTNEEIDQFFRQNNGAEFISFDQEANETRNFVKRYDGYHFSICYFGGNALLKRAVAILQKIVKKVMRAVNRYVRRSRNYPDLVFMKGSSYFDITHALACHVLSQKTLIEKIFKHTLCCDEVFLHTVAYNSPYREKITYSGTRFIDWSKHENSPEALTMEHYGQLMDSTKLFARKFSSAHSAELIQKMYHS